VSPTEERLERFFGRWKAALDVVEPPSDQVLARRRLLERCARRVHGTPSGRRRLGAVPFAVSAIVVAATLFWALPHP
jgi:hypothetical protein